ncbi:calcium-binding protein [Pararhizobium sp.]|uniref:calcium-binding protein n=1 Tax=Pararhizobium sp. TaxID=1977563 RepID=UPI003D0B5D8B
MNADSGAASAVAAKSAIAKAPVTSNATAEAAAVPVAAAAQAAGYPDATNTGVKAGTSLTKFTGTYYVTQDNAVISNMEIHGQIVIQAKNVTMSNVKLVANTWHALWVQDGSTGFTLKDSEIDGGGSSQNGVLGQGTFLRNNIHGVENGIAVTGPSVIRDNYIYGLQGGPDAHFDGIEINGGHDIDIIHNTVINSHDQAAAVMMNNEFGGLANINVDGNRLVGGGYTVYLDGRKGGGAVDDASIKITNNQIGDGYYGNFAFYDDKPVVSGNTDLNTLPEKPVTPETPVPGKATAGNDVLTGTAGVDKIDGLAGNDTINGLGGNDVLTGSAGNDVLDGGAGADKLDGGTGTDTASYASAKAGVIASLANATINTGDAKGDTYVSIEQLKGSNYADKLYGNSGANLLSGGVGNDILDGGAGADKLDGGAGTDTASYASAKAGVTASLANATINTGDAKGDTYVSIEQLAGSSYADKLYGNNGANVLAGGAGNDILDGGAGTDRLDGGAGTDAASYASAKAGVTASLANAAINTGDAKGDTYVSIEQLTGSNYADKLYGNGGANLLSGGAGNDVLDGGAGNDVLYGGAGADDLVGGAGADTFAFKALSDTTVAASGRDTIFDFSGTGGDRIDLSAIDANTAVAGNQAFSYLGTAAFTGKAGEVRYVKGASDTYVYGDVNGDAKADFAIHLDDAVTLSKGYFVL